ncbi:uncharacterized protein N7483_005711 [Penicillium malachiteum]|uniref:uncharacterized protein n=1 Tax=Penicillium malachiteum TaxID=1324776 RepID=UPI002547E686|nr:uncharacterized protein N7483_005711 [Penicillium malachiteum]KAJ5731203.1 hypothetical protein N7483_005711 [Penicillium malachiteum]
MDVSQSQRTTRSLNRSCEGCRAHKVRCLPDLTNSNQCQRCTRMMRPCIFASPQKRSRRKTGSRVAMLQEEIQAMRSLLEARLYTRDSRVDRFPPPPEDKNLSSMEYDSCLSAASDIVDLNILSIEKAERLVRFYVSELVQFFPVVTLPIDVNVEQLRRTMPILFLSIVAAASLTAEPSLATTLNDQLVTRISHVFFVQGEKSLELVQSLLVMIAFYYPPNGSRQSQYYQYTHIAATMAFELGLTSDFREPDSWMEEDVRKSGRLAQARAIIGCHYFASNIAVKTHRPSVLPSNTFTRQCAEIIEQSEVPTDRLLAAWFQLQQIVEDFSSTCILDNMPSTENSADAQVQQRVRYFQSRILSWKKCFHTETLTNLIMIEYHFASLTILELAIGEAYRDPEAIRRKYFTLPSPKVINGPTSISPISAADIDITLKRLDEAYHIMDAFLSWDLEMIRKFPNTIFTRVIAALTTLLKVFYSTHSDAIKNVIDVGPVNIRFYLSSIQERLLQAGDGNTYKIPSRWARIACKKGEWVDEFQMSQWLSSFETPICEPAPFTVVTAPLLGSNLPFTARQHDTQGVYGDLDYDCPPEPRRCPFERNETESISAFPSMRSEELYVSDARFHDSVF